MQTVNKIYCWLIGVTLVVAPLCYSPNSNLARMLISSAAAQQSSNVLEMQQLRREIAELRDMIERQQYQIRQLQRSSQTGSASTNPAAVPSSGESILPPGGRVVDGGAINGDDPRDPRSNTAPEFVDRGATPESSGDGYSVPSESDFPSQDSEFYSSVPPSAATNDAGQQPVEPVSENGWRSADVNQPSDSAFPPVVDRSIGIPQPQVQPGSRPSSLPVETSPSGTRSFPSNGEVAANQPSRQEFERGGRPPVGGNSSPTQGNVIQIPNAPETTPSAGASDFGNATVPSNEVPQSKDAVASLPAPVPATLSENVLYDQGFELLKQSKYDDAVGVFKQQIEQYPQGDLADDAHYWIAESMYLNRNLVESKKFFRAILDNFQESPRLPDAMLKTAYIEQDQGNEIEARILLQEIIQYHPRSDAAISAKNRLENL